LKDRTLQSNIDGPKATLTGSLNWRMNRLNKRSILFSLGAEAAKHATSRIPIMAAGVGDLAELGLVTRLARPGGNLSGFAAKLPEIAGKRLEIMKEIEPQAKRAALLWNPTSSDTKLDLDITKDLAGVNDIAVEVHGAKRTQHNVSKAARLAGIATTSTA
jgi:ABC-type uncharacterized transport system substrate-binding protein